MVDKLKEAKNRIEELYDKAVNETRESVMFDRASLGMKMMHEVERAMGFSEQVDLLISKYPNHQEGIKEITKEIRNNELAGIQDKVVEATDFIEKRNLRNRKKTPKPSVQRVSRRGDVKRKIVASFFKSAWSGVKGIGNIMRGGEPGRKAKYCLNDALKMAAAKKEEVLNRLTQFEMSISNGKMSDGKISNKSHVNRLKNSRVVNGKPVTKRV